MLLQGVIHQYDFYQYGFLISTVFLKTEKRTIFQKLKDILFFSLVRFFQALDDFSPNIFFSFFDTIFFRVANRLTFSKREQWVQIDWATMPQHIYNPISATGFSAMFISQLEITLRSKHCRHPIAIMGVVGTFGLYHKNKIRVNRVKKKQMVLT